LLGSAILPRLNTPVDYIFGIAKPDLIEIHDAWSCLYRDIFTSREFADEYQAMESTRTPWLIANCQDVPAAATGIWIRKAVMKGSGSPERQFLDRLSTGVDLDAIQQELASCNAVAAPRPCAYVGRTIFRFAPELKRAGQYAAVASRLASDPKLRLEHALVTSSTDTRWWQDAAAAVQAPGLEPAKLSFFALQDGSRGSHASIHVDDPLRVGWRIETSQPFGVEPSAGIGAATVRLTPKATSQPADHVVDVRAFAGHDTTTSSGVSVRFKTFASIDPGPPIGAVDAPPDPVYLRKTPVMFQGWAVDPFDLQSVFVTYDDRKGETITLGEARRSGPRPDIAALFPNAHDLFNAGWTFGLDPRVLNRVPLPVTLHFQAKGGRRIAEIGVRTINP